MLQLHYRALIAGVAMLFAVAACQAGSGVSGSPTNPVAPPPAATPSSPLMSSASALPESTDRCGSATISIEYLPYTAAILAGYGWDFVVADVVGFEPAIFNTGDGTRPPGFPPSGPRNPNLDGNAETLIYTPINVVIERTISGPWSPGPSQVLVEGGTVLLEGGPVGCFEMRVSPVPQVERGSRYVFILSEALDAAGQNPLPLPKARFAWPVDQAGMAATVDGTMSITALTEVVQDAAPSTEPAGTLPNAD